MKCRLQVSVGRIFGVSRHLSRWSATGLGSSEVALPVERKESRSKRGSNGCAKPGYTEQCALASALEWEFLGFRHGTRCTGALVLGSLNKSCGVLLLAPRVKPRWWSRSRSAKLPCGSAARRERFLGGGASQRTVTRLHGLSSSCRDIGSDVDVSSHPTGQPVRPV